VLIVAAHVISTVGMEELWTKAIVHASAQITPMEASATYAKLCSLVQIAKHANMTRVRIAVCLILARVAVNVWMDTEGFNVKVRYG